ncbi:MAG: hypothetical protein LH629_08975 [Ignavibacteria bacterium]|nr:hypothetical protein [Ignavibacteria bacterium]
MLEKAIEDLIAIKNPTADNENIEEIHDTEIIIENIEAKGKAVDFEKDLHR